MVLQPNHTYAKIASFDNDAAEGGDFNLNLKIRYISIHDFVVYPRFAGLRGLETAGNLENYMIEMLGE